MAKYIIKNNIPQCNETAMFKELYGDQIAQDSKQCAIVFFNDAVSELRDFVTKSFLRNEKDLRGTIQVEIDGFYYYVELYKEG